MQRVCISPCLHSANLLPESIAASTDQSLGKQGKENPTILLNLFELPVENGKKSGKRGVIRRLGQSRSLHSSVKTARASGRPQRKYFRRSFRAAATSDDPPSVCGSAAPPRLHRWPRRSGTGSGFQRWKMGWKTRIIAMYTFDLFGTCRW
jgi:hypothetical protein